MRHVWILAATLALVGCDALGLSNPKPPGGTQNSQATPSYGGLAFGPLSSEGARYLDAGTNGGTGSMSNTSGAANTSMAAPKEAASDGSTGNVAVDMPAPSPMMASTYYGNYYGAYTAGPLGPMKLESVTEATSRGASGGLRKVVDAVVRPVLGDWSSDAVLVSSNGNTPDNGVGTESWLISYAAPARREAMVFVVTPTQTRVLLLRWVPIALDLATVKVDSDDAIQSVRRAVTDTSFKSLEEQLGRDVLVEEFGNAVSKGGMTPVMDSVSGGSSGASSGAPMTAIAPMPAPTPTVLPSPNYSPTPGPSPTPYLFPIGRSETVYQMPTGGQWSVNLNPIGKYVVWQLSYYAPTSDVMRAEVMPTEGTTYRYANNYVFAMVDARTGQILRLNRPSVYIQTYTYGPINTGPRQSPTPGPTLAPVVTPVPTL